MEEGRTDLVGEGRESLPDTIHDLARRQRRREREERVVSQRDNTERGRGGGGGGGGGGGRKGVARGNRPV